METSSSPKAEQDRPNAEALDGQPQLDRGATDADAAAIRRHIRRLGRRSRVRPLAVALLEDKAARIDDLQPLLDAFADPSERRWRDRIVACWMLNRAELTPEQTMAAAQALSGELAKVRLPRRLLSRMFRAILWTMIPVLLIPAAVALINYLRVLNCQMDPGDCEGPHFLDIIGLMLLCLGLIAACPFVCVYSPIVDARRSARVREMAAVALGRLRQPECLWALAAAGRDPGPLIRWAALTALRKVLPALRDEHYGQLAPETVPNLSRLLLHYLNTRQGYLTAPDALALLEGLGKIGDGRAIWTVESIAKDHPSPRLRDAAERILPILRERQERDPRRLLRAAGAPDAPASVLLRPAQSSSRPDPQTLLRASTSDEAEQGVDG